MASNEGTINLCGCGCGGTPSSGRNFLPGHHMRLPKYSQKGKHDPAKYLFGICPYCRIVFPYYVSTPKVYCCGDHYWADRRGRTYEEIHGEARAKEIREKKRGQIPWNKDLTKENSQEVRDSFSTPRKGEGNPMYGKTSWNSGLTKETDERVAGYSVPRSLEARALIADATSKRIMENGSVHKFYKTGTVTLDRLGITARYRSSYEKKALLLLDSYSDVITVSVESIRIKYFWGDGSTHYYIPDLLVTVQNGKSYIIEIKPSCFVDDPINILKMCAGRKYAQKHNMTYLIWTEKFLFNENSVTTMFPQVTEGATAAFLTKEDDIV